MSKIKLKKGQETEKVENPVEGQKVDKPVETAKVEKEQHIPGVVREIKKGRDAYSKRYQMNDGMRLMIFRIKTLQKPCFQKVKNA